MVDSRYILETSYGHSWFRKVHARLMDTSVAATEKILTSFTINKIWFGVMATLNQSSNVSRWPLYFLSQLVYTIIMCEKYATQVSVFLQTQITQKYEMKYRNLEHVWYYLAIPSEELFNNYYLRSICLSLLSDQCSSLYNCLKIQ